MLRTAFVTDPVLASSCFMEKYTNITRDNRQEILNECPMPGMYPQIFAAIVKSTKFQFTVLEANGYGYGGPDENGTVMRLLKTGDIDFAGPGYSALLERMINTSYLNPSEPCPFYSIQKKQSGSIDDLNLWMFLRWPVVLAVLFVSVVLYFMPVRFARFVATGLFQLTAVAVSILVFVLITLYAGLLAIHMQKPASAYSITVDTVTDLRDLLLDPTWVILIPTEVDLMLKVMLDTVEPFVTKSELAKIRKRTQFLPYESVFSTLVDSDGKHLIFTGCYSFNQPPYVELEDYMVTRAASVFGVVYGTFYFTVTSSRQTELLQEFKRYVTGSRENIKKLQSNLIERYHNYMKLRAKVPPRFAQFRAVGMKSFTKSALIPILVIGMLIAVGICLLENVWSYLMTMVSLRIFKK